MAKTNLGLVAYARQALGLPYWNGTFGQVASRDLYEQKKKQLPSQYTATDFASQYGKIVHDCSGLVKGYFWKDSFTAAYRYESNGLSDVTVPGLYSLCKPTGTKANMPETPGLLVFKFSQGTAYHMGVYIGGGKVIEAKGHAYGVIQSDISGWDAWGKLTLLTYEEPKKEEPKKEEAKPENRYYAFVSAAMADGLSFGWEESLADLAKRCLVQQWPDGVSRYPNLTKLAQKWMGLNQTGRCDAGMTAAIRTAQSKLGLTPDGGIGAKTWSKLIQKA